MKNIYYKNKQVFDNILKNIQEGGKEKLHIVADFDRTLTKHFVDGEKRPSLISVLRREGYLGDEYTNKAYKLFDLYNPIETDPDYPIEAKKEKMQEWWQAHLQLIVDSNLHESIIKKVATSGVMVLRDGMKEFLKRLSDDTIPLVIISANGLGSDSIRLYLEYEDSSYENIHIISNKFHFNESGFASSYEKDVIHVYNKDETVLNKFPEIHSKIETRKNVILMGDSLGDVGMIEGFDYNNLIKIGFLNDRVEESLEKYLELYDVVLTGDTDVSFLESLSIF